MSSIHYDAIKPTTLAKHLPSLELSSIQRALLVGTVVCAILSLIPSIGFGGALTVRSLSVVTLGIQVIHSLKNGEKKELILLQIMRLASVTWGLAGTAAHLNSIVASGIALDILFHMIEMGRGAQQKDLYKSLSHITFILIDTFAMTALLTGGWQFAVVAASISSAAMLFFGLKAICDACRKNDLNYVLDAVCYIALMAIGIASAVRVAEITGSKLVDSQFSYQNDTSRTVTIYDKNWHVVATVEPGDSISFTVTADQSYFCDGGRISLHIDTWRPEAGDGYHIHADTASWESVIIQNPMNAQDFPTLPIGSSAVITREERWEEIEGPTYLSTIDDERLNPFLNPELPPFHRCGARISNQPTVTFIHREMSIEFDRNSASIISEYVRATINFQGNEQIRPDCDRQTFILLMQFFTNGQLNLNTLSEGELIRLGDEADFYQVDRLRAQCRQEVARRLKYFEWEESSLLSPYFQANRWLSPLVNLFNLEV